MKQIRKILRDKRGEGYIDVAVMVLCVMLVIGVRLFPIFITKMQVDNFADELVREAEISGRVGSETSNRQRVLEEKTGIHPAVQWSSTGNLQLNKEVTVTVTIQKDLGLFGNFRSPLRSGQEPPAKARCTGNEKIFETCRPSFERPQGEHASVSGGGYHRDAVNHPRSIGIHASGDYSRRHQRCNGISRDLHGQ